MHKKIVSLYNKCYLYKVWNLRFKAAKVLKMIGQLDESELPPFIRPSKRLVVKVTTLFEDVKTDVMNFYNVSTTF